MKRLLFLFIFAGMIFAGCAAPEEPDAPLFKKATSGNMVLYVPARYGVTATGSTGWSVRGFRLEDPRRESLAAIVETSSRQIDIPETSPLGFTSAAFAQSSLLTVLNRVKRNIPGLLPQASSDESSGDWSIQPVETGIFYDAREQIGIFGRYRFEFLPVYRLTSAQVFRYLAKVVTGQSWGGFPKNEDAYFPAGRNIIYFSLAIVFQEEDGFYSSENTSRKVNVSFGVSPENSSANASWDDLDDILTFKTLGTFRDTLVAETKTIEVPALGNAVDLVLAIDRNGSMVEEVPVIKSLINELVNRFATEADYAYRIGFLTQGDGELVQFPDGKQYLDPDSADPQALADAALDALFSSADGSTSLNADLLRTAALALTGETLQARNGKFRRPSAPLLLVTITDRDDASPALDGALLPPKDYANSYAGWLALYNHWVVLAPKAAGCLGGGVNSLQAATNIFQTAALTGADGFDLCGFSRVGFEDRILTWASVESSLFSFDAPQPFSFTLAMEMNGRSMKRGFDADFNYDVFGDRIVFQSSVLPKAGDLVKLRYQRLELFQVPQRK